MLKRGVLAILLLFLLISPVYAICSEVSLKITPYIEDSDLRVTAEAYITDASSNFYSPDNAVLDFYKSYKDPTNQDSNSYVEEPIPECKGLKTSIPISATSVDGSKTTIINYAECKIQNYKGQNIQSIGAKLVGPPEFCSSKSFEPVSSGSQTFDLFTTTLKTGVKDVADKNGPLCISLFALLGLFLATMYFTGKSPLALLDITTPRLPSPKSVTAAGSNLGQMVYGRMKSTTKQVLDVNKKLLEVASATSIDRFKSINPAISSSISKELMQISDPNTRVLLSALAYKMAEKGESMASIHKIMTKKSIHDLSREEFHSLGDAINKVREGAKKKNSLVEQAIVDSMDAFLTSYVSLNQMRILTGESGMGKRGKTWDTMYKIFRLPVDGFENFPVLGRVPLLKDIPGLKRLPVIGGFLGTSIDSLFRSARITGRFARAIAGGTIRTVTRMKNPDLAQYKKIADSPNSNWVRRQVAETLIAGSAISVTVGTYVPILRQMSKLYTTLYTEAHQDGIRYLLKRIFDHHGVNFNLTEAEVTNIGFKKIDIIEKAGLKNNPKLAQLRQAESEIKKALVALESEEAVSPNLASTISELRRIAEKYGVRYDKNGLESVLEKLNDIHDQKGVEDHIKLLELYDYLITSHKITEPIGAEIETKRAAGNFYLSVGRDSLTLRRNGKEVFSDLWEVYTLRNYTYNAEKGMLKGSVEDILKGNYCYLVSRIIGKGSTMFGPEGDAIATQFKGYLSDLLTPQGKLAAKNYGFDPTKLLSGYAAFKKDLEGDRTPQNLYVKFGDLGDTSFRDKLIRSANKNLFTGRPLNEEEAATQKADAHSFKEDVMALPQTLGRRMVPIGFKDKRGRTQFYEESEEIAPVADWWKVDMKRDWTAGNKPSGRESSIREYVEALFAKTKTFNRLPYSTEIEREIGPLRLSDKEHVEQYKKLMVSKILVTEMFDFVNGVMGMNAYKYTNETMRLYLKQTQGLLYGFLSQKAEEEKSAEASNQARAVEQMRLVAGEKGNKDLKQMVQILGQHSKEFGEYLSKPISYAQLSGSKHAWVLFHEGGLAPYVDGMPMSDFDRVMNGFVAINDKGRWRRFDPQRADVEKGLSGDPTGLELKAQFKALVYSNVKDKDGVSPPYQDTKGIITQTSWKSMFTSMKEWAGGDLERQKVLGAALWRYAQITDDWHGFWQDSKISIRPKNEASPIGGILPFAPHKEWSDALLDPLRKIRESSRSFGQWFERMSLYAGAPVYGASYDLVSTSEKLKQNLWALNTKILSRQFESQQMDPSLRTAFQDIANVYPKYHIVWLGGIDRNPWGFSTSYGLQSSLAVGYHYGSASMWDFKWYRPYMEKSEWIPFNLFTLPVKPALPLGLMFYRAFRGSQMAAWAYPGRWEYSGSPMNPYNYSTGSKIGMLRSFLNPFYSVFDPLRAGEVTNTGRKFDFMNQARGSLSLLAGDQEMVRRDLGGQKYIRANAHAPQDAQWIMKGEYAVARYGAANPAAGHYTPRFELRLASRMAHNLIHGHGTFGGYFETDPSVSDRAYETRVKRELSSISLATKREEELRGFGMFFNSLWAWGSPLLFLYHLPFSPVSPRDMLQHFREGKRTANWEGLSSGQKARQVLTGRTSGTGFLTNAKTKLKFWETDEEGKTGLVNPLNKDLIPCSLCGNLITRFGQCSSCKSRRRNAKA